MPLIAAFTAAEVAAATAAAEAAAVTAAQVAAAEAAAAAAAQTAAQAATATAAETAIAAVPEAFSAAAPTVGGPMAMGLPEATALAPMEAGAAGITGIPSAGGAPAELTRSISFGVQPPMPVAGVDAANIAGAAPTNIAGASPTNIAGASPAAPAGATPATTAGAPSGILQAAPPPAGVGMPTEFTGGVDPITGMPTTEYAQAASAPSNSGPMLNNYGQTYTTTPTPTAADFQPAQLPPGAEAEAGRTVAGQTPFDKFVKYAEKNPFTTGAGLYMSALRTGMLDQKGGGVPQKKSYGPQYRMSENFQAATPTPNVYTPSYKQYAEGGVMEIDGPEDQMPTTRMEDGNAPGYAKGGTLSNSLDFYKQMTEARSGKGATAPKADADVGIYYDQDPDTRYQDALTAAQIRQAKLNKRSNVQTPSGGAMRRPTPMGQINLAPPGAKEAAQGGIMQAGDSSLGGYAAGGNPRLLKGPGDGMSDNIPAMIGRKQPARLADGEFVIPADVVSHLGNGSTEAGAKRLHEMMNNVRRARTGNPKQGKQINPRKYMPK